jgi:hypothetical protein
MSRAAPAPAIAGRLVVRATLVVVCAAWSLGSAASPAAAEPSCPASRPAVTLQISTVPTVPGARIDVGGTAVVLDGAGRGRLRTCRLADAGSVTGPDAPVELAGKRRARFDRVFLSDRGSRLQVAFGVEHQVSLTFLGLPTRQITRYTLRSSTGAVITYDDLDPVWLLGSRVLRGPDGLEERGIYYSVDSVLVAGSSVVNRSQTKFYPDERAVVRVPLLAFDVDVYVVDRLFRFPVGRRVTLRGAEGLAYHAPLEDGKASFSEIPRNTYAVVADAPGLEVARGLTLSGDQLVVLPILTWLDLLVLVGGPTALATALVLAPRPVLRRRIVRSSVRGARAAWRTVRLLRRRRTVRNVQG